LTQREAWFEGQPDLDPQKLVFIDETAATTALLHGSRVFLKLCGSSSICVAAITQKLG
jgi:hypothetical protein